MLFEVNYNYIDNSKDYIIFIVCWIENLKKIIYFDAKIEILYNKIYCLNKKI